METEKMALAQVRPFLTSEDQDLFYRLLTDPKFYIETNITIRSESKGLVPFRFNTTQAHFHENLTGHDLILKPRRLGFSTYLLARGLHKVLSTPGTTAFIMAHDPKGTDYLFEHLKIMFDSIDSDSRPKVGFDNAKELTFPELHSKISVSSAGATEMIAKKVGRTEQVNFLLLSEFAYYPFPVETWTAISQTVPPDGEVFIESTANGHNEFYDRVMEALSGCGGYKLHFYRWFDEPKFALRLDPTERIIMTDEEEHLYDHLAKENIHLTAEQIKWRRYKIVELRNNLSIFKQEYPEQLEEAFLQSNRPWLDPEIISERVKSDIMDPLGGTLQGTTEPIPQDWRLFVHPVAGHRYVISADCAEGLATSHFDSADVLDCETGEQVCHIYGRLGPLNLAKAIAKAGRYYVSNGVPALIAVEKAMHGAAVLLYLDQNEHYPDYCIYKHEEYDDRTKRARRKPGWVTSSKEKPLMCDALHDAYMKHEIIVHDSVSHLEMRMLQLSVHGLPEKMNSNAQDDCMMSLAIAWRVKGRKPFKQQGW